MSDENYITQVGKADYRAVSKTLALAFAEDPVMAYIFPEPEGRVARIAGIMRLALSAYSGDNGLVESVAGHSVAIWQRPNPAKPTLMALFLNAVKALVTLRSCAERAMRVEQISSAAHYKGAHWYLAVLGTEPQYRGKYMQGASMASRLLDSVLARCDQEALPAYLESSNRANIGFYQRHGFEVTEEIKLPNGTLMWGMLRPST